ncbi:hypothetical protein [Polaribacter sp. SA4-12]|uniref:hypothetical protein n=1 Tax=Polaribacter sp. SA4-12 TaxID=1312072 RepID=UPI000B3C0B14|nr:hypothetical protein [Polaribacter sp. SA4-12]ARV14236.1 hypothetical protein BTO07_03295 [Polaribacter sp. SA4-12]
MKNIIIIFISFLLLAPPMQAHTDVVVYSDVIENHLEIDDTHEEDQHKNDSDDEKNTEHHHHCTSISLVNVFIPIENQINFTDFYQHKEIIIFKENANYFSYLKGVFQPPKNS